MNRKKLHCDRNGPIYGLIILCIREYRFSCYVTIKDIFCKVEMVSPGFFTNCR